MIDAMVDDSHSLINNDEQGTDKGQKKRSFAGFTLSQLLGGVACAGLLVWGAWATREIVSLTDKKIVSVSLASMANDFVMTQARSGASPEQVEADTRHYMSALQTVLNDRSAKGETIIVSEAVVGGSVPDVTPDVRSAVGKLITENPPPRLRTMIPQQGLPAQQGLEPGQNLPPAAPQPVPSVGSDLP